MAVADADRRIEKVIVLNDCTAGTVATAVAAERPVLNVTCLFDKSEIFLLDVARMALREHPVIAVREHEPNATTARRTRGAAERMSIAKEDESVLLLVLPQWIDPDHDASNGPTFDAWQGPRPSRARRGAVSSGACASPRARPRTLRTHYLNDLAPSTFLKNARRSPPPTPGRDGDEESVAVIALDEPARGDGDAVTLRELRRLRSEQWAASARGLLAGSIVVGMARRGA